MDTGVGSLKTASKEVVHKAAEFLGNNTADAVTQSKDDKTVKTDENLRKVEAIIILLEKRDEILNKLRRVL